MKTSTAVNQQAPGRRLTPLAPVLGLDGYKERRVEASLKSDVHVKGRGNALVWQLFSKTIHAAVLIRHKDRSYTDPCDYGLVVRQMRKERQKRKEALDEGIYGESRQ